MFCFIKLSGIEVTMAAKIIMLGDSGVGKTSILNCYETGNSIEGDIPPATIIDCVQKEEKAGRLWRIKVLADPWNRFRSWESIEFAIF